MDQGAPAFWALDPSDSRMYLVPENLRVDVLVDQLFDFIGKDFDADVVFKPVLLSKRGEQIIKYVAKRREKYAAEC